MNDNINSMIDAIKDGVKTYEEVRDITSYEIEYYIKESVAAYLTRKFVDCCTQENEDNLSLIMKIWKCLMA